MWSADAYPLLNPCAEVRALEHGVARRQPHFGCHRTWQRDRVRASCLTTRPRAKSDARLTSAACALFGIQPVRCCSNPRSSPLANLPDMAFLHWFNPYELVSVHGQTQRCPWCHLVNTTNACPVAQIRCKTALSRVPH